MRYPFAQTILLFLFLVGLNGCGGPGAPARAAVSGPAVPNSVRDSTPLPPSPQPTLSGTPLPSLRPFAAQTPTPTAPRIISTSILTLAEMAKEDAKSLGSKRTTNVALASEQLFQEGLAFSVIVVSPLSTGIQARIYDDLTKRHLRATSGPDEGIDTTSLKCHPNCVFIHYRALDEIGVESWKNVLRHEQRHMVQALHNPNLARDFRRPTDNLFTTYAAFMEACADDGIYVAEPMYRSSVRMPELVKILGGESKTLLTRACLGYTDAYQEIVGAFELKGGSGSFANLFPPYK